MLRMRTSPLGSARRGGRLGASRSSTGRAKLDLVNLYDRCYAGSPGAPLAAPPRAIHCHPTRAPPHRAPHPAKQAHPCPPPTTQPMFDHITRAAIAAYSRRPLAATRKGPRPGPQPDIASHTSHPGVTLGKNRPGAHGRAHRRTSRCTGRTHDLVHRGRSGGVWKTRIQASLEPVFDDQRVSIGRAVDPSPDGLGWDRRERQRRHVAWGTGVQAARGGRGGGRAGRVRAIAKTWSYRVTGTPCSWRRGSAVVRGASAGSTAQNRGRPGKPCSPSTKNTGVT